MVVLWPKLAKMTVLRGNRPFFFLRFQWNSDEKWRFHVFFGVRTWNLWWFHWNRGFLVELEALHLAAGAELEARSGGPRAQPGVRPPTPPKIPRFQWIPPQVSSFYSKKYVNTPIFSSKFHWIPPRKNKKIWRCFLWNPHLVILRPNFGHEYHHTLSRLKLNKVRNKPMSKWINTCY